MLRLNSNKGRSQVLSILLFVVLTVTQANEAYAINADDLRALVGKPALDTIEYHDYLDYANGVLNGEDKATARDTLIGRMQQLSDSADKQFGELKRLAKLGTPTALIDDKVDKYVVACNSLYKNKEILKSFNITVRNGEASGISDSDILENRQRIEYLNTLVNDTFEIGGIGIKSQFPIKSSTVIVTSGFQGIRDGAENNGAYFYSVQTASEQGVQSMTNGVVTEINHSDTWGNWLLVQAGKGLSVSYSLLGEVLVKPGDSVQQGTLLSKGTQHGEVYVETKLDGEYINPCVLLGEYGINAHNKWYKLYTADRGNASELSKTTELPNENSTDIWVDSTKPQVSIKADNTEEETISGSGWN